MPFCCLKGVLRNVTQYGFVTDIVIMCVFVGEGRTFMLLKTRLSSIICANDIHTVTVEV